MFVTNLVQDSQQKKHCRQDSEEGRLIGDVTVATQIANFLCNQNEVFFFLPCFTAEASQNGSTFCDHQNGVAHPPNTNLNQMKPLMPLPTHGAHGGATGPATNLNIGMGYWGGPTATPMPLLRGKVPAILPHGAVIPTGLVGPRDPSELWV